MSFFCYIAFPRPINAFRYGDIIGKEREFGIEYYVGDIRNKKLMLFPGEPLIDSLFYLLDKENATFNDCFTNEYIYEYTAGSRYSRFNTMRSIINNPNSTYFDLVKKDIDLKISMRDSGQIALCDFIKKHSDLGDNIELYHEFGDHENFNFGPPNTCMTMTLLEYALFEEPREFEKVDKLKVSIKL